MEALCVLEGLYWVCRRAEESVQGLDGALAVVVDIAGTTTVVSGERSGECIGPYRVLASGVLDPGLVGFMAKVSAALASAGVPVMVYSSFERDYILVPAEKLSKAIKALEERGFEIVDRKRCFQWEPSAGNTLHQ